MSFAKILNFLSKHATLFALILFLIGWTIILYQLSPSHLVEHLGVKNSYAVAFLLAFFGGLSVFTAFPYYLVIATLGAGGLNPFLLGLTAGMGVIMGDSTSYLIGYSGREVVPSYLQNYFRKFCEWCLSNKYSFPVSIFLFLYGALVPFPNDLIVIPMGLARYPYWRLMIPLGIGNIAFNIGMAFIGAYGFST